MSYRVRLLFALLVFAAGLVPLVGYLLLRSPITEDNVARVRPGMGLRAVEQILGGPGVSTPEWRVLAGLLLIYQADVAEAIFWDDRGRTATVFLDADGVVLGAIYIDRREGWLP